MGSKSSGTPQNARITFRMDSGPPVRVLVAGTAESWQRKITNTMANIREVNLVFQDLERGTVRVPIDKVDTFKVVAVKA